MFSLKTTQQKRHFAKVYKNYVNGQWVPSASTKHIDIISPLNQDVIAKVP
jgi:hypothetical protein